MSKLDDIIHNPLPNEKINDMYLSGAIGKNEMFLLKACKNEVYLRRFLTGSGEYKLYYKEQDGNSYFTNVNMVLNAFYSLYKKYPNYNFDEILKYSLTLYSQDETIVYQIINIIYAQMENEKTSISPFSIVNIEMLQNCKHSIKKVEQQYKNIKLYEARNCENGYMDVITNLNDGFKKNMNYDILDFDDSSGKKKK